MDSPHFLFASDGAAAVEQALKIAFQYWLNRGIQGRTRYLCFADGYHGDTVGSLSLGGGGFGTSIFDPLRFPVLRAPAFNQPGALARAAQMVREHQHELAAVMLEPLVQGAAGMLIAPAEDFAALADACRDTGVLLVCDEVATGFGRTGTLFASEQCGLRPDLMCLGKGITGGYLPMSATVAAGHVYQAFLGEDLGPRTLYHGHSYGGNALAAAVALRHLELMDSMQVLDNVRARSIELRAALEHRLQGLERVREIRLAGLMGAVELDLRDEPLFARRVSTAMVARGVLTRSMGPVITLVPPLTSTTEELDRIAAVLAAALKELS